mmetsp:Transcript_13205/g.29095  ORF Transcript_13205/g.29095 Transcript_13205/m.29095 type:complete len:303 (-) Transcript_13205:2269-3177(-)
MSNILSVSLARDHAVVDMLGKSPVPLMKEILRQCVSVYEIPNTVDLRCDHLCWRCETKQEYLDVKGKFEKTGAKMLIQSMIGGRPIASYKLREPIIFEVVVGRNHTNGYESTVNGGNVTNGTTADGNGSLSTNGNGATVSNGSTTSNTDTASDADGRECNAKRRKKEVHQREVDFRVDVIEVPCPKPGRPYSSGWEHCEFCFEKSPEDAKPAQESFQKFVDRRNSFREGGDRGEGGTASLYPSWILNLKVRNRDISFVFDVDELKRPGSVKFHALSLETVIENEVSEDDVIQVPEGYFDDIS